MRNPKNVDYEIAGFLLAIPGVAEWPVPIPFAFEFNF